mgnify:CR=1 FL=1
MLMLYDTKCKECGAEKEQCIDHRESFEKCPECGCEMQRIFTTMNYKLVYDNKRDICSWGDHGYATSQYWKKVKEERAKGNDVKPVGEE